MVLGTKTWEMKGKKDTQEKRRMRKREERRSQLREKKGDGLFTTGCTLLLIPVNYYCLSWLVLGNILETGHFAAGRETKKKRGGHSMHVHTYVYVL